jgi:hypothetical protein
MRFQRKPYSANFLILLYKMEIYLAFAKCREQDVGMKTNRLIEGVLVIESDVPIARTFSADFLKDIAQSIDAALGQHGIVNVPLLAEQVRRRNERENIALEDIEAKVMQLAQTRCAIMEFETPPLPM